MDDATVAALADRLAAATRDRAAVAPLSAGYPGMTPLDAYRIQQLTVAARTDAGERIVGWKVGLTSRAMQQQLGVDSPDYAAVLSGMLLPDGGSIPRADLIAPRVEAEIAFVLDRPLHGPGVTASDVRAATRGVCPAIEVIDSRIADWKLTLPDTIADMASSARVVAATDRLTRLGAFDLRLVGVVMEQNDAVVSTGAGAAALGDPAEAVAWAVNTLGALGVVMDAGAIIMPGALHASVPANAGDLFTARFDRLGPVSVRFT